MNTITTEAVITKNHKLSLNIDLPESCPTGKATVTVTIAAQTSGEAPPINTLAKIRGKYEGQIWMSEDFDEPLEEFAEYM